MALTLTASTVVASVKPTVSSNRRSSKVASFSKTVVSAPVVCKRNVVQQKSRKSVATAALSPMEISQIADAAAEIGDVATTLFGCTLIGLTLGFVLLRVESTVEGTD
ncbi:unnamed protein product [Bathycoccus prasinos]